MSCRHDLATSTCSRCYPGTGKVDPGPEEDREENLEGPGAVPRAQPPAPGRSSPDVYDLAERLWAAWNGSLAPGEAPQPGVPTIYDGTWAVLPTTELRRHYARPRCLAQARDVDLWRRMAEACLRVSRGEGPCPCCGRGDTAETTS